MRRQMLRSISLAPIQCEARLRDAVGRDEKLARSEAADAPDEKLRATSFDL